MRGGSEPGGGARRPRLIGSGLLWIFTAALALRLVVALAWAPSPVADAADYDRLARGLVEGRGYVSPSGQPTAWRPPLYPGFVAAVYAVAGEHPEAVRVAQAVVGAASAALVYVLAFGLLGSGPAWLAGGLAAVDLASVFSVSRLLSEALFTFLLVLSVALVVRALGTSGRRSRAWALGGGLALGLGALTRGALVLYPVALVPVWLLARRGSGRALLAVVFGFVLAISPWTIRNERALHAFVPVATQGGLTLWAGNHPLHGWIFGMIPDDSTTRAAARLPEPAASSALVRATARDLVAHPGRIPRLEALKAAFFWAPLDWEILPWYGAFNPTYAFELLWSAVLVAMMLRAAGRRDAPDSLGTAGERPTGKGPLASFADAWPLWLPVAYFFALALVFYGSPRFRLPVEPLLAVSAAAGLARLARTRGRATAVRWAVVSAAALLLVTVAAGPLKAAVRGLLGA
jgi:4-amino-4-deoxy-L-arabinose transferase-like glycosyltransferase